MLGADTHEGETHPGCSLMLVRTLGDLVHPTAVDTTSLLRSPRLYLIPTLCPAPDIHSTTYRPDLSTSQLGISFSSLFISQMSTPQVVTANLISLSFPTAHTQVVTSSPSQSPSPGSSPHIQSISTSCCFYPPTYIPGGSTSQAPCWGPTPTHHLSLDYDSGLPISTLSPLSTMFSINIQLFTYLFLTKNPVTSLPA